MARMAGWILAGGIVLATATAADAQFARQLGNPYQGGLFNGLGGYGNPGYYGTSNVYPYGVAAPATTYYSSGYVAPGFVPGVVASPYAYPTVYPRGFVTRAYRPLYPAYGYGGYRGYGRMGGYRGWRR